MKDWKVKSSKYLIKNPWIKVRRDDIQIEDEVLDYYIVELKDDVIVAGLKEKDEFLFVRQYRPAANITSIELPAGYIDKHESGEDAARNELREETGYEPKIITYLGELHRSPTRIKQKQKVYFAEDLVWKGQELEIDEKHLEVLPIKINEAIKMIKKGKITDMATVASVYMVNEYLKKNS